MPGETALFLVRLVGFAGFLWLGLYVVTRGDRGRVPTLFGLTALATACFFLSVGLLSAVQDGPATVPISRASWWASVVPVALWLHLSLDLNPRTARTRWRRPVLWAAYGAATLLALLGTATNLVRDYGTTVAGHPVAAGPAYALYVAYLLVCVGLAAMNFGVLAMRVSHTAGWTGASLVAAGSGASGAADEDALGAQVRGVEVRLLAVGALFFLLGAGHIALNILLRYPWSQLPGYALLLVGLGALSAAVAMHSALLLGKDIRRDVVYSLVGLATLLALYLGGVGMLTGFDDVRHRLVALLLAALVTSGHTLPDAARTWLDRAFFTPAVRRERAAARAYADVLAVQPAGPHPDLGTAKAFDDAVRRALTHLSDPTKLATSPLLNLVVVAQGVREQHLEDNRLNRAIVLKEVLLELLDRLRPHDGAGRVTSDAWRFYNCLYYPYVRGISRRRAPTVLRQMVERRKREGGVRSDLEQVVDWLVQVNEDTFYKWQRRGSDTIAAALREREVAAGGVVPMAGNVPAPPELETAGGPSRVRGSGAAV
jgi:hypothetical protein